MNKKRLFSKVYHSFELFLRNFKILTLKLLSIIFLFTGSLLFSQIQKIDSKFKILLDNKGKLMRGEKLSDTEMKGIRLDQKLVVTPKATKNVYSCIIYTSEPEKLEKEGIIIQSKLPKFVTALVTIEDIEKLSLMPEVISVVASDYDSLNNDVSRAQSGANLLQEGFLNNTKYTGTGVLVGIYDTGIDWKHLDFRNPIDSKKSRIISIWDQTITPTGLESSPSGFSYGVEYTKAHIEDEIDGSPSNFVRESDTNGHGSHVSGTLAGNGASLSDKRHKGFAPDADIVFVKGGNGSFPTSNTIDALTYFRNVATALNKPIVVNMSIGGQSGPHDGTMSHEVAVDNFVNSGPGRVVVISAGNDYAGLIHKKIQINSGASGTFSFNVNSNTSTSSILSFICFANDGSSVIAKLTTPDGQSYTQTVGTNTTHSITGGAFTAYMANYLYSTNLKRFIQFSINRVTGSTVNAQGTYTLEITNDGTGTIEVDGWKSGGDVASTLVGGDSDYTVGSPGTATNAITVASYKGRMTWYAQGVGAYTTINNQAENISSFSSKGPRLDGYQKPDITASGEKVVSVMSSSALLASTSSSNYDGAFYRINQGTSMSSPGVAGAVALLLQANPNLSGSQVKARLINNARKDIATGTVPNYRWGYGKLDIYKAVSNEVSCVKSEFETINYDEQNYLSTQDTNNFFDNYVFAVRYTPKFTGRLGGVTFYTGSDNTITDMPISVEIRKVDVNGNPGDLIANKTINSLVNDVQKISWNYVDFASLGVSINTGQDYYVVINAKNGRMSLRSENIVVDNRSKYSIDGGLTWSNTSYDYRIRSIVYENVPEVKALAIENLSSIKTLESGRNFFTSNCQFVAKVDKEAIHTISGNTTAKVWLDNSLSDYVGRRYEINPQSDASTSTGRVTLYFTQQEFDAYNATHTLKLPTSSTDNVNKVNLLIEKYLGNSSDNTGVPNSYSGVAQNIIPAVNDIKWNATYNYWEVSFETSGFGGFLLKTSNSLAVDDIRKNLVKTYPNPVIDVLNINLPKANSNAKVLILDSAGRLLKQQNISGEFGKLNIKDLAKGIYYVTIIINGEEKITNTMIKE